MELGTKDMISFIASFSGSIITGYLFFINLVSLNTLIFILVGAIIVIIIAGFQSKIYKLTEETKKISENNKKLDEKLKIYERLINIEARLISLEKNDKKN